MKYLLAIALACAVGCGELQPDDPDSKLNSGNPSNSVSNTPNNQANNLPNPADVDAGEWGTDGPATNDGKSPDGNALCELSDVVTEDLGTSNSDEVPDDPWGGTPVADSTARCGDDHETLGWRLYNCERIARGLQPFACDMRLVWMGREHTLDMIRWDYFRHDNPAGESPFDRMARHGIGGGASAENIASASSVIEMHHSWMDSRGHRENILGPYSHAGLGTEPHRGFLSTAVFNNNR